MSETMPLPWKEFRRMPEGLEISKQKADCFGETKLGFSDGTCTMPQPFTMVCFLSKQLQRASYSVLLIKGTNSLTSSFSQEVGKGCLAWQLAEHIPCKRWLELQEEQSQQSRASSWSSVAQIMKRGQKLSQKAGKVCYEKILLWHCSPPPAHGSVSCINDYASLPSKSHVFALGKAWKAVWDSMAEL